VLQKEDKEGRLILSKKRAQYERAWARSKGQGVRWRRQGPRHRGREGGLIVDIGLRGSFRRLSSSFGGCAISSRTSASRSRPRSSSSTRPQQRRAVTPRVARETQREQRGEFLVNLKPGEVRKGVVSSVVNFGAFVDLGGMDGLVHVSELSWKHVDILPRSSR